MKKMVYKGNFMKKNGNNKLCFPGYKFYCCFCGFSTYDRRIRIRHSDKGLCVKIIMEQGLQLLDIYNLFTSLFLFSQSSVLTVHRYFRNFTSFDM